MDEDSGGIDEPNVEACHLFGLSFPIGVATWNSKALFASIRSSVSARQKMQVARSLAQKYHVVVFFRKLMVVMLICSKWDDF